MDNVALKEVFARALSCFSPFWLQLGVDVVVGGGIVWKRRGDLHEIQKECIAALFRDRDLEIEFGTGHVPGAPPFAHGYEEALSRSVLKRVYCWCSFSIAQR
jgi:abnormal spindle-like microcephaly-associated protein